MTCTAKKPKSESKQKIVDFYITSTAYVLFEHGFEKEKVLKILQQCEDVADSMVKDYIEFCDIRNILKDEYNFTIEFKE